MKNHQFSIEVKNKLKENQYIKAEEFKKEIRTTTPHKHSQYFEIIYLSAGSGYHWIDEEKYPIEPPVLFFVNRNQTHHWEITSEPEGYVVIFKQSFTQESKDEMLKQLLLQLWHANCVYLKNAIGIANVFKSLCDTIGLRNSFYSRHIIDGLLKALVAEILQEGNLQFHYKKPYIQLYVHYTDLLHTQNNFFRNVSYYARQLNTSQQNLNMACRKAIGQSAGEILDNFIIDEAKRLLLYTDNQISEVAYKLNFKDPSYFIKFFKKYNLSTPEAFRKGRFQNYH
ncbi:MAG: helix-turn-helix domain-containing protein [Bacteroidetes bacterium]|nr:helix-turn-helix domain-containing protein [Bacteroidota bacterium]